MKATITQDYTGGVDDLAKGAVIEIVGYVHHSYTTWALYLADDGYVEEVPLGLLRVEPPDPITRDFPQC